MELNCIFEGIKELNSKEGGKTYKLLSFIYQHKIIEVFDFNDTLTTILLDNRVQPLQEVVLVYDLGVDKYNHLCVKVKNVKVK